LQNQIFVGSLPTIPVDKPRASSPNKKSFGNVAIHSLALFTFTKM